MHQPDPDLVDRIFEFLAADSRLAGMDAKALSAIKRDVRAEFKGEQVYVAARPASARQERVAEVFSMVFDGQNATTIARVLGVSKFTVYRVLKQAGGRQHGALYRLPPDRCTFPGNATAPPLPSDEA